MENSANTNMGGPSDADAGTGAFGMSGMLTELTGLDPEENAIEFNSMWGELDELFEKYAAKKTPSLRRSSRSCNDRKIYNEIQKGKILKIESLKERAKKTTQNANRQSDSRKGTLYNTTSKTYE